VGSIFCLIIEINDNLTNSILGGKEVIEIINVLLFNFLSSLLEKKYKK
jgi:hypothetical protein